MSGLFVVLWAFFWVCTNSENHNNPYPQSMNCMALGGSSPKSEDVLEISYAYISKLSTAYFLLCGYQNVSEIKIRGSRVKDIEEGAFMGLNLLERLDLSHNYLRTVTTASFRGLEKLQMLVLSFNEIQKIEEGSLKSLTSLIFLDLKNNSLTDIPSDIQELSNLVHLDMSNNDFSNTNVILKSSSLSNVIMSSCKINTLTENSFRDSPQLTLLDISKNFLKTLPQQLLRPLTVLTVLVVSGNPFDKGFPDIYKPETLTKIETSTGSVNSTLHVLVDEQENYSVIERIWLKVKNNIYIKAFVKWCIVPICGISVLLGLCVFANIKSNTNKRKKSIMGSHSSLID